VLAAIISYPGNKVNKICLPMTAPVIQQKSEELKNWLSKQGYQAISPSLSAACSP
jgi:hypothetical protein